MGKYRIGKTFTFDAAHFLPEHEGKCRQMHGHTYKVEVVVESPALSVGGNNDGMVIDFGNLSKVVNEILDHLDHTVLNDSARAYLGVFPPTAEKLAEALYHAIQLGLLCIVSTVTVWETPTSWASYSE